MKANPQASSGCVLALSSVLAAASLTLLTFTPTADASVLAVDFGTAIQTGFTGYTPQPDGAGPWTTTFSSSDPSVPLGTVGFTIAGGSNGTNMAANTLGLNSRDRNARTPANSGAFTYHDLFSNRIVVFGGTPTDGLFVQLTGFTPNTQFSLQVWGIDWNPDAGGAPTGAKPGTFSLYNWSTGSESLLGSFTSINNSFPTNDNSYSVTGLVTSDITGKIVFQSRSNIDGQGIMNGFTLNAVPEPATWLLTVCGLTAVISLRKRRSRHS